MKKVLVMLALCVPFAAMLAVNLQVDPSMLRGVPSGTSVLAMPEVVELAEDEGDWESGGWSMGVLYKGERLAVRLSPGNHPFEIKEAGYIPYAFGANPDNWQIAGDLVFFGANAQGEPTTELGRKTFSPSTPYELEWFDVSDLNITISSGDFFFGLEALEDSPNPGGGVPTYPATASDFAKPLHHRSWIYADLGEGKVWYPLDNVYFDPAWMIGDSIDLILRVKGEVTGVGEVVLGPDGAIEITPLVNVMASTGTVDYTLPTAADVEITLWDALGRRVQTFYTGHADAGEHTLTWDASALPSGAYFIRLRTPSAVKTARVVLIH